MVSYFWATSPRSWTRRARSSGAGTTRSPLTPTEPKQKPQRTSRSIDCCTFSFLWSGGSVTGSMDGEGSLRLWETCSSGVCLCGAFKLVSVPQRPRAFHTQSAISCFCSCSDPRLKTFERWTEYYHTNLVTLQQNNFKKTGYVNIMWFEFIEF